MQHQVLDTGIEAQPPGARAPLEHRVALVAGGTHGIGAAISRRLAADGAQVAAGYWRQDEVAEKFLAGIRGAFPDRLITLHHGNIGSAQDCRRVVRDVIGQHGRLDILVNSAGITIDRALAKMTDEDWHRVISVSLSGAFLMGRAALEQMMERGTGRIVNVSPVTGEAGRIGQPDYAAARSGLVGLTRSLAREARFMANRAGRAGRPAGDGIGLTVNGVMPGHIVAGELPAIPAKVLEQLRSTIPAGRPGRPDEVARVVSFLAADESAYITGQIWAVNGGLDM